MNLSKIKKMKKKMKIKNKIKILMIKLIKIIVCYSKNRILMNNIKNVIK